MNNEVMEAILMGAKEINKLRNENKELQERIIKAIEYIENHNKLEKELGGTIRCDIVKLSNILKGE